MVHVAPPISNIHHCFGVILHHRAEWWFVEFPGYDLTPIRVLPLTGGISDALRDSLRRRRADPALGNEIATVYPGYECWCGDFSLVRSAVDPERFDIAAHPWGADAGELDARLARTMVESTLFPIPAGFISVFGMLPNENVPVLAIRASSYLCATFELITARYMPSYRPRSPWRDISNDAVSESGCEILGWTP